MTRQLVDLEFGSVWFDAIMVSLRYPSIYPQRRGKTTRIFQKAHFWTEI
jgi:hypothetical protein